LPFKRGFTNINRAPWEEVNLDRLAGFAAGSEVTPQALVEAGLIDDPQHPVAVLGRGELTTALTVRAHRVTAGARAKIEAAGGTVELLTQ
jgi:large subunit ribosomal protein L15